MPIDPTRKRTIEDRIAAIRRGYPEARGACLPALYAAQEVLGHLDEESLALVAAALGLAPSFVQGVATFYTLFHRADLGRFHLQLCTNVSCHLNGGEALLRGLEAHLGIRRGETTPDGLFTLDAVECLAACGSGPVLMVNDRYHERMDLPKIVALLDGLRAEAR